MGIIGCGGIAIGKFLPAMKKNGKFEIVAFCDTVLERAIEAKEQFGTTDAKVTTDYKELLKEELDGVYVLTPNSSHAEISIAAMKAGKHVMCEKPMAKTYAEAKEMVKVANETGKLLNIGYQNRYRTDSQYLKKICENGELGEIYYAKAHAVRRRAVPTWGVFLDEEKQGGGPLIDIGTHALDLTLWVMDNYEPQMAVGSVYRKLVDQKDTGNAWGDWDNELFTVEDSAFGYIKMKNGATIILESSWALNTLDVKEGKTTLCGTKAGADMEDGLRINKVHLGKLTVETPQLSGTGVDFFEGLDVKEEEVEQEVFYQSIVDNAPLVVKPEQALVVTQILEGIYESSKTGRPVYF
jgi:predicted dehydrogenase